MTTVTHHGSKRIILRVLVLLSLALSAVAQSRGQGRPGGPGTGKPDDELVPWKFVEKGAAIEKRSLTLYWIPDSQKETEQSPLLTSRALIADSLRCVAFRIVLPDNAATIELLSSAGNLPTALLVNAKGEVIHRIVHIRAVLPPVSVEEMVHTELAARDVAMYHEMSEARKHALAGEKDAAIALYKTVWNDRCFFPLAGTEAQRGLKALGVEVHEDPGVAVVDPQLSKPSLPSKPKGSGGKGEPHGHT